MIVAITSTRRPVANLDSNDRRQENNNERRYIQPAVRLKILLLVILLQRLLVCAASSAEYFVIQILECDDIVLREQCLIEFFFARRHGCQRFVQTVLLERVRIVLILDRRGSLSRRG